MNLQPPTPPTAPAPAVRPTPPTPPRIDMTPFSRQKSSESSGSEQNQSTPEAQARDAVAHGSGPLTKRTVNRDDEQPVRPNQKVIVIPPDAPLVDNGQSNYDRGKDVLRQFREMDARDATNSADKPQTSIEQSKPVTPHLNHYQEGHGVGYWLFTIIFMAVAAFIIVKKFLLTDKPALTKSQLFEDSADRLKTASERVKPVTSTKSARATSMSDKSKPMSEKITPVTSTKLVRTPSVSDKSKSASEKVKPVTSTSKESDKGKHFEVRI